ncbi:CHAT domain-containing protein [Mycena venus]|uniref:CHAT domain-containing protein n=1 Tax=Mycena venus TaxID=2733690 RepID=A0A8H7DCS4_9AGAR|nr:CHAT domain-containing protein [Mycena venus]
MDIASAFNSMSVGVGDKPLQSTYVQSAYKILANSTNDAESQQNVGTFMNQTGMSVHAQYRLSRNPKDLDGSIDLHREALVLHPQHHPERPASLNILGQALETRFQVYQNLKDLDEAIGIYQEVLDLYVPSHPERAMALCILGTAFKTRCQHQGNPNDLDKAIDLLAEAQGLLVSVDPNYATCLTQLADAFEGRFSFQEDSKDLDKAVDLHKELLTLSPLGNQGPDRGIPLNNLGDLFRTKFQHYGDLEALDEAIGVYREALVYHPQGHSNRGMTLTNLGYVLQIRSVHNGDLKDLIEAIDYRREVVRICVPPHPKRGMALNNLGNALQVRFEKLGDPKDLDEMTELYEAALVLHDPVHPDRGGSLMNMANALRIRYSLQKESKDIDMAIDLYREALAFFPRADLGVLRKLALALQLRFAQLGDQKDIDEAIKLHRKALDFCSPWHPDRSMYLHELAMMMKIRAEGGRDLKDIDGLILVLREGLTLCASDDPSRGMWTNNLANAIQMRFANRGNQQDMDEAIELRRESLLLRPEGHPDRDIALDNLASTLSARFNLWGDSKDSDEATGFHREALNLWPPGHPKYAKALSNLAATLHPRVNDLRDQSNLDEAIELYRKALALSDPGNTESCILLDNLGMALRNRFEFQKSLPDLEEAIQLHKQTLSLRPYPHPQRSISLDALAIVLRMKFQQAGVVADLEEAFRLHQEALALEAPPHPLRSKTLMHFGRSLVAMYHHSHDSNDLDQGFSCFKEAATYSSDSPLIRFGHAQSWAQDAVLHNHASSLEAYEVVIELLPQVAAVDLDLPSRQKMLPRLNSSRLAREATICAVGRGQYNRAVEFLEAARAVFWSQALQLRREHDSLAAIRPDLSGELTQLSKELERASFRDSARIAAVNPDQRELISFEAESAKYRRLNQRWQDTIKLVRTVPGFESFMRPKTMETLKQAAAHGPIIILTVAETNCSALIITSSSEVQHLPLPFKIEIMPASELPPDLLDIRDMFSGDGRGTDPGDRPSDLMARLFGAREDWRNKSAEDTHQWLLMELWTKAVKPVFDALKIEKSNNPPRLWWCPTGPFAFLPIHAAGIYGGLGNDCVSDYVISSYTTTISALLDGPTRTSAAFKMTAIVEPNAPNLRYLPGAHEELKKILNRIPRQWLTVLGDTSKATVETSLTNLRQSAIVHFACHGIQDLVKPLESGLFLHDGRLRVSDIMCRPEEEVPGTMSLAFLNACETAKGDAEVVDEAMHLAATLLFSGFGGIVGTMWAINDADGPKVADVFYEHLFENCDPTHDPPILPDVRKAAEALHVAVAKLRAEPDMSFKRWVPFVHYGL